MNIEKKLNVRIVLPNESRGWILEKFAVRLVENLPAWNVVADISSEPSPTADINHWGIYHVCKGARLTPGTFFITHVDSIWRLNMVQTALKTADIGICMSSDTVRFLRENGIRDDRLCYISPASDLQVQPRRIVIGLTTNIYPDKCKREDVLISVAKRMRLDSFEFRIIGKGWEPIIPELIGSGATVNLYAGSHDYTADYRYLLESIPQFDYYLYMGLDEGSMGLLDALAAGVPTIVTPQGFHIDIPNGITHSFWDENQLAEVFAKIQLDRNRRIQSVQALTWNEYAKKHAIVWRSLLDGRLDGLQTALQTTVTSISDKAPLRTRLMQRLLYFFKPARNLVRRLFSGSR